MLFVGQMIRLAWFNRASRKRRCDTRPHYGLPGGGRAVYCATHKEDGMVHVFKEASTQRKQEVSRCVYLLIYLC